MQGPMMNLLSGSWGVTKATSDGKTVEVFQSRDVIITVPTGADGSSLSSMVFGSYAYEHLCNGAEVFVSRGVEFMVPPSAVSGPGSKSVTAVNAAS